MPVVKSEKKGLAARVSMPKKPTEPLWKGPIVDGISQSLISRYLCCPERFRVRVIEGLSPPERFDKKIEFGNMWHVCEETLASGSKDQHIDSWQETLKLYCLNICRKFPIQQEEIGHWFTVCKTQFPIYVKYWSKHKDVKDRTPLLQEQVFDVPYTLPSGRVVRLRGKWDSVDLIGKGKTAGIYLVENKSKGDIDQELIPRQLSFDLQVMIYLVALQADQKRDSMKSHLGATEDSTNRCRSVPIKGVRYNVVRRPLSGGEGSIRQYKPTKSNPDGESKESFYSRLGDIIEEKADNFFMRWKVDISQVDIEKFKTTCLNPILENLCDDYEWWSHAKKVGLSPFDYDGRSLAFNSDKGCHERRHFILPFGLWNPIVEVGYTDLDEYLNTGSTAGLVYGRPLFSELEE